MSRLLEAVHVVRTPEQVEFEFPLAGPAQRFLAWFVDVLLIGVVISVAAIFLALADVALQGFGTAMLFVVAFLVNWGWFVAFEWLWAGRTPGKRLLGLRVLSDSGVRVQLSQVVLRNLLRAVDHLPLLYLVGGGSMLLSEEGKRLGDRVAGTIVVRERRRRIPASVASAAGALSELASDERLLATLRARATPAERELLVAAALRREELSVTARLGVFGELAALCEERFGVVRPAHLSEEKLVLHVALALLRDEGAVSPSRTGGARSRRPVNAPGR